MDPFRTHLMAILSLCEVASSANAPFPKYTGPPDSQTNAILKSIGKIAQRMWTAEAKCRGEVPETTVENLFITDENLTLPQLPQEVSNVDRQLDLPAVAPRVNKPAMTISLANLTPNRATNNSGCPSPFIIPGPFPLAASSFEAMSPIEELRLLKAQVSDIARVCNAVARGDLAQKITVPVQGVVMVQLKDVTNSMVDRLRDFAVGLKWAVEYNDCPTARKPIVKVEGTWLELLNAAEKLSSTLQCQTRAVAHVATAVALGDLDRRIGDSYKEEARGESLEMCIIINGMVERLQMFMDDATHMTSEFANLENVDDDARIPDFSGDWLNLIRKIKSVCSMLKESRLALQPKS